MSQTAVRERPILFSGRMVHAILEGRKSVTRRVVKPQPPEWVSDIVTGLFHPTVTYRGEEEPGPETYGAYDAQTGEWTSRCPYGAPGDRLWVRETFSRRDDMRLVAYRADGVCGCWMGDGDGGSFFYRHGTIATIAESPRDDGWRSWGLAKYGARWRPSIHMPRWASRILLEITEVRVERLQEITPQDAVAEGSWPDPSYQPAPGHKGVCVDGEFVVDRFAQLWDSINAACGYGWDANPWVWVVRFRRLEPTP